MQTQQTILISENGGAFHEAMKLLGLFFEKIGPLQGGNPNIKGLFRIIKRRKKKNLH